MPFQDSLQPPPPLQLQFTEDSSDFILNLLATDPNKRPSATTTLAQTNTIFKILKNQESTISDMVDFPRHFQKVRKIGIDKER